MDPTDGLTTMFATELRARLEERRMSLAELHRRLAAHGNPVSMAALSYWRSGARQPEGAQSLAAVDDIEDVLGLDRGRLSTLIRAVPRLGRRPAPRPVFSAETVNIQIEETARALGTVSQADLRDLSVSIVAHVDAQGDVERVTTRVLVQAGSTAIKEIPLFDVVPTEAAQAKTITDAIGGRVDRSLRHPDGRIVCDVVALDAPIPPGETGLIEYAESMPGDYPDRREVWHGVDRQSRQILIWVLFHSDAVPDWCEEYSEAGEDHSIRLRPIGSGAVHVARFGFGPGVCGIRWGFDADD